MSDRSERFQSFLASVTRRPTTREEHESYDVWSLRGLEGDERDEAERVLIERLHAMDGDRRAIDALAVLGEMGSTTAFDALQAFGPAAMAAGHYGPAIDVMRVLQDKRLAKKADVVKVAVAAIRDGAFTDQTTAAGLLARLSPKRAVAEIMKLLKTMPLDFVRGQLFDHLLTALGQADVARDAPGTFARLHVLIAGHTLAARDTAMAELGPIVEQLAAGRSGKRAGISAGGGRRAVREVIDTLKGGTTPPVAMLDTLDEDGRAFVSAWCQAQLPSQTPAHYETIAALGDRGALPVVNDALSWDDDMLHGARPHLEKLRRDLSH